MAEIDYYFTCVSPYAYLGHQALLDIAKRRGATINPKPFALFDVWKESGAVPVPQRPKMRQDYRLIELQRWREARGLALNLHPAGWPTDPTLADCAVIALDRAGGDALGLAGKLLAACWAEEANVADEEVVAERIRAVDGDPDAILGAARSEEVAGIRERNTNDAIAANAVGAPAYVLGGEPFWGQDRLALLDDALRTGRKAYAA